MPNAIHPNFFKDIKVLAKEVDEAPIEDKEEIALFELSEMAGWKVLKEYVGELKEALDRLVQSSMSNGASFEEVGQKTIVTTLAKSFLDQVVERVENAKEARRTN